MLVAIALIVGGIFLSLSVKLMASEGTPDIAGTPSDPASITLIEAWDIAEKAGREWQDDALVVSLNSVDLEGDATSDSGLDGRRRAWQAVANSVSKSQSLWIHIADGKVTSVPEDSQFPDVSLARPIVDSPIVIESARASDPTLKPASGKATGWHYALGRNEVGQQVVSVLGSSSGRATVVEVDPVTGHVGSEHKQDYAPNGAVLVSSDGGLTWSPSSLVARATGDITSDPSNPSKLFEAVASYSGIEVHTSSDYGSTWTLAGVMPLEAESWPYGIAAVSGEGGVVLLVGTHTGLWRSDDLGKSWSPMDALPAGPAWQVSAVEASDHSRFRVAVSVVWSPEKATLYDTTNLKTWSEEAEGVYRLSELTNDEILAIDENNSQEGRLLGLLDKRSVPLPGTDDQRNNPGDAILRAAGAADPGSRMLVGSPSGVAVSDDGGLTWSTSLVENIGSLGVSPSFDDDGVAVAGGFHSGIFRTVDGGLNWSRVVESPTDLVPCSGIVSNVLFLDSSHVVAVISPTLEWVAK